MYLMGGNYEGLSIRLLSIIIFVFEFNCPNIEDYLQTVGKGNISSCAEFNFYADPEAAHIVLHAFKCPIIVVPWKSCLEHG